MAATQYNNPTYESDIENTYEVVSNDGPINNVKQDDMDIEFLQTTLEQLASTIVFDTIDATNLTLSRTINQDGEINAGPGSSGDDENEDEERIAPMKIASLEGFGDLKETNDYAQLFRAVIGESKTTEERITRANESLINYFALLGAQSISTVDFEFVESLTNVADLNSRDIHGQSIMHEIAREWSNDIAKLLLIKGMNIDLEDKWGRTPLFVAAAANHVKMVTWLIDNGADINHQSMEGQGQQPIHFAAKHNAVEAFETLVERGANPLTRDHQSRTPFFVAAHAGHQKICKYMLDLDLPTVSYSSNGEATIDHILDRLPNDMASVALNQFVCASPIGGKLMIYLSCLGKRRWKLLSQSKCNPTACKTEPPGPLEVILTRMDSELITHPAILYFIKAKSDHFASKYINMNSLLHLLFTLLWTLAVTLFKESEAWYSSRGGPTGVIVITSLAQIITFIFIYKFYRQYHMEYNARLEERERVMRECAIEQRYCHPRWRSDKLMLEKDIEVASTITYKVFTDGWNLVEVVCLMMATVQAIITFVYMGLCDATCVLENDKDKIRNARMFVSAVFILIVWIRLNICFRYHQQLGPFIAMLGGCVEACVKIGFLFFEFFIPFSVACWVFFGGSKLHPGEDSEYSTPPNLIYQVYLLTIVGDYDYDPLAGVSKIPAQLFVGIYALVVSIITINLYIALLSEAYSSISATASARAYLQQAISIRRIEMFFPELKLQFESYINKHCAPMIVDSVQSDGKAGSAKAVIKESKTSVVNIAETMKKITEEQNFLKKDISNVNEMFRAFQANFNPQTTTNILEEFNEVRKNEEKLLVRLSRGTDKKFSKLIEKIKELVMLHG